MKVHLIPDENLDSDLYTRVLSLLQAVPGVNKFYPSGSGRIMLPEDIREEQEIPNKDYFEKQRFKSDYSRASLDESVTSKRTWSFPHMRVAARWRDLFQEIQHYRQDNLIPENEFAILLTPIANRRNWFAVLDENRPFNGFIHTDEWEHFISCDPAFPIAFEVMTLVLQKHIFENYSQIARYTHERAIGCISDLCMQKSDIILKMRTADICPECMVKMQSKLSVIEIGHALSVLESLRIKMLYAQNFRQNSPPSKLVIRRGGRIYLPDYGNIEIRMPAMEKALYLLFLRYPEGLYLGDVIQEFNSELSDLYIHVSTRGLLQEMRDRISKLKNDDNFNISVPISRIKKAFTDAIGVSLADHYIIQGENAGKKGIKLSRNLVENYLTRSF